MKSKTKKISNGIYLHLSSGKYISLWEGISSFCWNIFNDEFLTEEHAIGFNTKKEAIESLDIFTYNLEKLQWYKSKGRSKESLIESKVFSLSFIEKNY